MDESPDWDAVEAKLNSYPWVVWELTVYDRRDILRSTDVPELTRGEATRVAELYGCVYEYCVDDDWFSDGTKYYKWYIGVKQSEHRQRFKPTGFEPVVVCELLAGLLSVLPKEFDNAALWESGPVLSPTYQRNEIDNGYTADQIARGTTDGA